MNKNEPVTRSVKARLAVSNDGPKPNEKAGKEYPKMTLPHHAVKGAKEMPVGKTVKATVTLKKTEHRENGAKDDHYGNQSTFDIHNVAWEQGDEPQKPNASESADEHDDEK